MHLSTVQDLEENFLVADPTYTWLPRAAPVQAPHSQVHFPQHSRGDQQG